MNVVLTGIEGNLINAWNDIASNNANATTYLDSTFEIECVMH